MCAPSPPPAPDYTAAAQAQGAANVETARVQGQLSNPNIYAPWGSQVVTWGSGGSGGTGGTFDQSAFDKAYNDWMNSGTYNEWTGGYDRTGTAPKPSDFYTAGTGGSGGVDQPTVTISLSPEQQARYDAEQRIIGQLGGIAESGLGRVSGAMATPFSYDQFRAINYGPTAEASQRTIGDAGTVRSQFGDAGAIQRGLDFSGAPGMQSSLDMTGAPELQGRYDFSGVPGMPVADEATRQRVSQAILARQEPGLAAREQQARSDLIARGFREGTQGFETEMDRLARVRNDAGIAADVAGGQELQRIYDMGMRARQQGVGEAVAQGNFGNAARQQALAEALTRGNFGNQARQQAIREAISRGTFANTAQAQEFAQALQRGAFENDAQRQRFQEALSRAGFSNQAIADTFQRSTAAAQFQNDARARAVQEALFARQLPLNELNALRTGSQVQMPQFQPFQGVGNIQPPPLYNAAIQAGQYGTDVYNAQVGQQNALMSGLFGLGAAGMMAPAGTFSWLTSDRRLKSNIVRVGTHPLGIGIYEYDLFGRRERGVMADEVLAVKPEAVRQGADGYFMVNYGGL